MLRWADGREESIDVRVNVTALPAGTSSKDMEAEVIPVPRAVAPGGVVKLMYSIFSYEDTDQRVRLRVDAGPGWRLLDPEIAEREILVEAWEIVEGELYVMAPEEAPALRRDVRPAVGQPPFRASSDPARRSWRGLRAPGVRRRIAAQCRASRRGPCRACRR
jgi:hypothetical protein